MSEANWSTHPKNGRKIIDAAADLEIAIAKAIPGNPPQAWENARRIVHCVNCHDELLAACEAAVPWVAVMTSDHDPYRHPQSVANAKADLDQLRAAIAAAKPEPAQEQA